VKEIILIEQRYFIEVSVSQYRNSSASTFLTYTNRPLEQISSFPEQAKQHYFGTGFSGD